MTLFRKTHQIVPQITAKSNHALFSTLRLPTCDQVVPPYEGPGYDEVVAKRTKTLVPCIKTHFQKPLLIHKGHMQWLFDHSGKRYLDMFGGIATVSVGHCHPRVIRALQEQSNKLWHVANIYMHPLVQEYAEKLLSTMPGDLKVVYFVNSGSEANDLAIMLARLATGNNEVISLRNCYHGGSTSCIGLNALNTWKYPINTFGIHHALNPDVYKGRYGGCRDSPVQVKNNCGCDGRTCSAAKAYAEDVEEIIRYSTPRGKLAAFIAESIQGVGGSVQFPKGYLPTVYEMVKKNGGLCIADEVQTGFGRTGEHFWGFQGHGVVPDIVTMAKGIGNGFPLGAVVTTHAISQALEKALHYNTFSGNPLASAVGLEVLKVIEDEKLQENSLNVGTYLLNKLAKLRDEHSVVGDVRGKGLMIGVEMVQDSESKAPLPPTAVKAIWETCREHGLLLGLGGYHANVFRIKPPMCVTNEDADFTTSVLEYAIQKNLPKV